MTFAQVKDAGGYQWLYTCQKGKSHFGLLSRLRFQTWLQTPHPEKN